MHITENTNIVQSNYLIENRPLLTKDETRLFLTIIGAINKDDSDFKPLQIPVNDFADLWGIDSKNAYQQIKAALRGLRSKEFYIEGINPQTGKMRFITASSVSAAVYEDGEGYATIEISQLFKPYLLGLKEQYTKYVLQNIMNLSSVNAIRNYEILKQYQSIGQRKVTLIEYKRMLRAEDKYPRNIDLKRYVIEPSIKEINAKTDIYITYEFGGRGDQAYVIFIIEKNKLQMFTDTEIPPQKNFNVKEKKLPSKEEKIQHFEEIERFREASSAPNLLSHEQFGMFDSEDKLAHERDLREEVCEGFQESLFDEFTLDQLKEFRELAIEHLDQAKICDLKKKRNIDYLIARDIVLHRYVQSKILMCNGKGEEIENRLGFIRSAIAKDYR